MRYLLVFMLLVAVFVLGKRNGVWSFGSGISGEGPVQTQTRAVSGFQGIQLDLAAEVEASVSEQYVVEVSAQENLMSQIRTEVADGVLRIYFDGNLGSHDPIKIRVSAPAFNQLAIGGSGRIAVASPFMTDRLRLEIGGSGDISVPQMDAGEVSVHIGGSGNVQLGGKAGQLEVGIDGSGEVGAKDLAANICKAHVNGSGKVTCNVSQRLEADVNGSGDVFYTGTPEVDMQVAGSGSVKKL